jgi:DNA-binding IclR family transcriptional regulator
MEQTQRKQQGIQSIEVGTRLLHVLAESPKPMMLRDLAGAAEMPAAKAHRYLVSYMRMGLVTQDAKSACYDLGEFALELGLARLSRIDVVRLADPILDELCEHIGETVALAIWGSHGATCVRWVDTGGPVTIGLRTGVVLPLTTSATGLAFAAFSRSTYMKQQLERELTYQAEQTSLSLVDTKQAFENRLNEIRGHGIARASGSLTPGINGFSAPVFDHTGRMTAAITSLGTIGHFDVAWDAPLAQQIKVNAESLSRQLGYRAHTDTLLT